VKEEEGSLLPSLERLEANVEEDKTVGALEMKAVHLALSHFRATLHLKSLVLATDNTTVVAYRRR
jgi:hypothetical protein